MSQHTAEERQKFQLDRIALFSDAVFAIAITLLVIDLKVPSLPYDKLVFTDEFRKSMIEMIPEFIGFLMSFLVIGSFWRAHHTIFGFVIDYSRKFLSINTFFLLTIVLMPFRTAFMSRYLYIQPFEIYVGNVCASGILEFSLWRYIVNPKNKIHSTIPKGLVMYKSVAPLAVVIWFMASLPVHIWFGGFFERMFLLLIFVCNMIVDLYFRRKYKLGKKF